MSESRRRRKSEQSGASDDHSGSFDELNVTKETQSSEQTEGHRDSEYDTAGSDAESDGGSQDGVQRESGDGQEEDKPQKKLDDDEDRRNPQYIPKRGTFYEHDDRTTEEVAEDAPEPPAEREVKEKKVWKDKEDRWDHDRYNDEEQAPKSHEELIAVYGYDIRNEEGPPRARRRRRYGRGPNKYTRNWEDEDAYGKTTNVNANKSNRRINKTGEEFPALGGSKDASDVVDEPVISSAWYSNKNKIQNKQLNFPPLQSQQDDLKTKAPVANNTHTNENKAPNEPTNPAWKKDAKYTNESLSTQGNSITAEINDKSTTVHVAKNIHTNKRQVQESVSLAASRVRGRGFKPNANNNLAINRTVDSKPKGRGGGLISGDIRRNNTNQHNDEQLVNDLKHMNVNDGSMYHHSGKPQNKNFYAPASNQQRQNAALPRIQSAPSQQPQPPQQQPQQQQTHQQPQPDGAGNRPKRYSSLRQRPQIPDVPGQQPYPAPHGQHGFYPPQGFPPGHFEQAPPVPTSAPSLTAQPVMPLPNAGQAATYPPPAFLVPPPQFIAPQTAPPSIINYVPGPNGPAFPPNFPGYQGYNPTVPPQGPPPPPELFQPQGCTYYNPAQQPPQQPQSAPLRRPKAAIPILPPPDNAQHHQNSRGRGRAITQQAPMTPGFNQLSDEIETRCEPMNVQTTDKESVEVFENAPLPPPPSSPPTSIIEETEKVTEVDTSQPPVEVVEEPETPDIIEESLNQSIPDIVEIQKTIESTIDIPMSNEIIEDRKSILNDNNTETPVVEKAAA